MKFHSTAKSILFIWTVISTAKGNHHSVEAEESSGLQANNNHPLESGELCY